MDTETNERIVLDMDTQGGVPRLRVELVTGELEVSGWDKPQVEISSPDADEDLDIEDLFAVRKNGNEIVVGVNHGGQASRKRKQPKDEWDFDAMIRQSAAAMRSIAAGLDVKVPFGSDVEVRTADGDIVIRAVDGRISANSASGQIRLEDVQGSAIVKSASGDVTATGFAGRLGVRTMSGEIEVHAGDLDGLSVGTASGDVAVTGRLSNDGEYEIQTVSGDVELLLPGDTRAVAEVQTVSGDIDCELPHETQKSGRRRQKLAINGGEGPLLRINTTSGDVEIAEWHGAPEMRHERRHVTEPLGNPGGEQFRSEGGETVRIDQEGPKQSAEMAVLQAIEAGEMTVDEGLRRLSELSQGF